MVTHMPFVGKNRDSSAKLGLGLGQLTLKSLGLITLWRSLVTHGHTARLRERDTEPETKGKFALRFGDAVAQLQL